MNINSLKRALSEYSNTADSEVRAQLEVYGPILLKVAEISNSLTDSEVSYKLPSKEAREIAKKGGDHVMQLGLVQINPEAFLARTREIATEFLNSSFFSEDFKNEMKKVDFSRFTDEEHVKLAQLAPMSFIEKVSAETAKENDVLLAYFVYPVLKMTLRAFLDKFALEVSRDIESTDDPVVDYDRTMTCPICGSLPVFAAVLPTQNFGNCKRVYCSVCGGYWKFERIRCVACGDEAVSDLKYVHEEGDEKHRLHVCAQCGEAMPTLFSTGDALSFNPDIESIVLSGLYNAYQASQAEKK